MNKSIALLFACLLCTFSCNNELDLVDEGDTVPITYAIIDALDTAHYFRIEKAFIDQTIPPAELAKDINNFFFPSVNVTITNLNTKRVSTLTKVDGAKEGYPRQEGLFATVPNTLYKLKNQGLNWSYTDNYQLDVVVNDKLKYSGATKLVKPAVLIKPSSTAALDFDDTQNVRFSWNSGDNSIAHSMVLNINISESTSNGPFVKKTLVWKLFEGVEADRFEFAGKEFYGFLNGSLTPAANVKRFFDGVDVMFTSGGESLSNYVKVSGANLGITSSGEVPSFSNLTAGRGVFGSVSKVTFKSLALSRNTIDRLKNNDLTKNLNFQ